MVEEIWTLRRPVGVKEGECKRSENQSYDVEKRAGGEKGERETQGEENEREIPGQVYHRLAERERAGWGQRNSLLDENSDQGRPV